MARLVVSVLASVDGYFEGPGGDLSSLPFEDAFNDHNLSLLETAGTLVYGGTWFPENWRHWAAVSRDATAPPRDSRIAHHVLRVPPLIISDKFRVRPEDPWADHAESIPRTGAVAEIRRRKAVEGGDLVMFGSADTWNPLMRAGVVDELIVLVGEGLAGAGRSLYAGAPIGLELLDATQLPASHIVRLRYRPRVSG